ncbi:uncharacterized protein LOC121422957 [Lytechinus variegatus]|uniref:uncharacterized protein LOC121422957 n=1 Tax=Lytechinus variegatus TaxID=7654 RepID=UPI001BB1EF69|nr:uncharacterized protein LOC121422957 [Lytechinus variegatus]
MSISQLSLHGHTNYQVFIVLLGACTCLCKMFIMLGEKVPFKMAVISFKQLLPGMLIFFSFLKMCSSAVENCEQGEFFSNFFGVCFPCSEFCPGAEECLTSCPNTLTESDVSSPALTLAVNTTPQPQSSETVLPSTNSVQQSSNSKATPGMDITFPKRGKEHNELPFWLVLGIFIILTVLSILLYFCLRYHKAMKMPELCCFRSSSRSADIDIELGEMTITTNPLDMLDLVQQSNPDENGLVQVHYVDEAGPSRQSLISTEGTQEVGTGCPEVRPFQSATVQPSGITPVRECETHRGARPSDQGSHQQSSSQKTPETHRKITDGTDGVVTIGASCFHPPCNMVQYIQRNHQSEHAKDGD